MSASVDHPQVLEAQVEVGASPTVVWSLVGDVRRMAQWSPQVAECVLDDGFGEVRLGARFTNHNVEGADLRWTTHGEVVRFDPEREVAFRIDENWAIWSFVLEPLPDAGTRLVQRREIPDGLSELSRELADAFMGGAGPFTEGLRAGMRETLERVKEVAEASVVPHG